MPPAVVPAEIERFLDAWLAVRQLIQAANFNHFQGAGLSATQFMTLNLLPPGGDGLPIGDLARRMNLKPATVAKTVDSLEARHLVVRSPNPKDKRRVSVAVTSAGSELQNAAKGGFQAHIAILFEKMPPQHREGLILGLESIARAAAALPAANAPAATRDPRDEPPAKRSSPRSLRP